MCPGKSDDKFFSATKIMCLRTFALSLSEVGQQLMDTVGGETVRQGRAVVKHVVKRVINCDSRGSIASQGYHRMAGQHSSSTGNRNRHADNRITVADYCVLSEWKSKQ